MPHTRKIGRVYNCKYAPFVTNWHGVLLDKKVRDHIAINDSVRVLLETKDNSLCRYVDVKYITDKYITGVINDPYNGMPRFYCNNCNEYCGLQVFACSDKLTVEGNNGCDFHLCHKCRKTKHEHKMVPYKHAYCNGTILVFKKTCIMEIPDWTKNADKIINQYINKDNRGRIFTGVF